MAIYSKNPSPEPKKIVSKDEEQLWDVKDLARYLKVKVSKIYSYTRQKGPNSIPRFKLDGCIRFRPKEIDLWLDSKRVGFQP